MSDKINPVPSKIHPEFHNLLISLQTDRISEGKETSQTKISLWKLTKTISNMVNSNPDVYKRLVEVDIK